MSAMVQIVPEISQNESNPTTDFNGDDKVVNFQQNISPEQLLNIKAIHQEAKATEKSMADIKIDTLNIKKEPEEKGYPDIENISTSSDIQRPETVMSHESDLIESAMTPRYHRARYFRRNYSSPECAVCEVCQAEFGGPDLLRLHKLAHFNTASVCYVCDSLICDTNGESLGSKLMLHMTTHHKAICIPSGNYKPEAERAFVCPICLQRFSSNKILTLHTLKQHNQSELTNFTCKICSMDFISARALHTHLLGSRHKDMKIKVQSIFMCVDCRAIFPARDSYAMHMMMRAQSESCTPLEECVKAMMKEKNMKSTSPNLNDLPEKVKLDPSQNGIGVIKQEKPEVPLNLKADKEETKYTKGEFLCESCNLQFFHPDTLHMHRKMMHLPDDVPKNTTNGDNHSTIENLSILTDAVDTRSLIIQNAGMSWTCVACGYDFDSCDSLAMHVMDQHSGDLTIPVTSSICRNEQRKVANTFLGPLISQMMYKPPVRKIFENATTHTMLSPQSSIAKMPPLHLLTPHTSLALADAKLLNNINLLQFGSKRNITLDNYKESDLAQPPPKQMKKDDSCEECKIKFETNADLQDHKKVCDTFYSKCSFCHVSFHDKDVLLQHLKHCNPKPIATCCNCKEDLKNIFKAIEHGEICKKNGLFSPIQCEKCQTVLHSRLEIQSHFSDDSACCISTTVYSEQEPKAENTALKRQVNMSDKIDVTGGNSNSSEHTYTCKQCPWVSDKANDYVTHMVEKHQPNESGPQEQYKETGSVLNHCQQSKCIDKKSKLETTSNADSDEIIQTLVQDAVASKRNKRKLKPGTRVVSTDSPEVSWHSTESGMSDSIPDLVNTENSNNTHGLIAIPVSPNALSVTSPKNMTSELDDDTNQLDATGHEHMQGQELLSFILGHSQNLIMCKYCHIVYSDRTMYYLHMGLHNLNNPWQCNLCGKVCANVHEFSSHVIHYR